MPLNPVTGDDDSEIFYTGTSHDLIEAMGGNDTVYSGDGKDLVNGGEGDDALFGGFGDDRIHGSTGNDIINGEWGDDRLFGGAGDDRFLAYDGGGDSVWGGDGNDFFYCSFPSGGMFHGGKGMDHFTYYNSYGADALSVDISSGSGTLTQGGVAMQLTSVEKLTVYGGVGDDSVTGGRFKDQIQVYAGANVVDAGAGNDNVVYTVDRANTLDGGLGIDTLYVSVFYHVALDFDASGGSVDDGRGSTITGFEKFVVYGGSGYDSVRGGGNDDSLFGGRGGDNLHGKGGNDRLFGLGEDDALFGGGGDDSLSGGADLDVMTGGDGADTFIFAVGDGNGDVVTDFASGEDVLHVRAAAFSIFAPGGVVVSLDAAEGLGGQFVLDTATGYLEWDGNGAEDGGTRIIAVLIGLQEIVASDIVLF